MKKLLDFFRKNLPYKIVSFTVGLVLWIIVTVMQPDVEVTRKISLSLILPNHLIRTSDMPGFIDITLVGPGILIRKIKDENLAYEVDATRSEAGEMTVKFIESRIKGLPQGARISSLSPTQINIKLDEKAQRKLPVNVVFKGKPQEGFHVSETVTEPDIIEVSGALSEVSRLKYISTEMVDITGRKGSLSKSIGLDLAGQHISLVDTKQVTVKITIEEKKMTRKFENIPIQVIGTELKAIIKPGALDVNLQGPEMMIRKLQPQNIQLVIDASALGPGTFDMVPKIRLEGSDHLVRYDLPKVSLTLKQGKKFTISSSKKNSN